MTCTVLSVSLPADMSAMSVEALGSLNELAESQANKQCLH